VGVGEGECTDVEDRVYFFDGLGEAKEVLGGWGSMRRWDLTSVYCWGGGVFVF